MQKHKILMGCLLLVVSSFISMAQNIDLKLKNATVEQAITALNKAGNYSIVLNPEDVNLSKVISIDAKNASIESVMDQILAGQNLTYSIDGKMVKISKKAAAASQGNKTAGKTVTIKGTVSDANGPLPGAAVMVKGTTNGTVTDVNGEYTLTADPQAVILISSLGYKDIEQSVNGRGVINVTLAEDAQMLEDVVILGYGAATKKKDLSAAVGVVADPEKLAMHPITSTQAMLQGQIPGVTVTSDGGAPTSTPSVVIRGQGSKNGDSVLWVVDGVPGAPINTMEDIESIVVLKDAASAAIYGAQSGAGGVILVTTKKATKGISISYDGLVGVRSATNVVQSLNAEQEIEMRQRSYAAAGQSAPDGWNTSINPWIGTTRTNWVDEIFRNALYHRHNVVLNAGWEKFKNRVSFVYDSNDGVLVGTYSKKTGVAYRGEFQKNNWLKITEDLSWNQTESRGTDTNSGYGGSILSAVYMPQSASREQAYCLTDASGNWDGRSYGYTPGTFGGTTIEDPLYIATYGSNFSDIHGDAINPLRTLTAANIYPRNNTFYTSTALDLGNFYNFKGFRFVSRFTYYLSTGYQKSFQPMRTEVGKRQLSNGLYYSTGRSNGWKTENTVTYDNTFGKHSVGALFSTTANYDEAQGFGASASGFADESDYLQFLSFASTYSIPTDYYYGPDSNVALIGRLSYSYDDRYFVTASWRRDYAGRLPKENNYGDFPAVTGAWKISSEPFFGKSDAVSLLKIRASWGRVGNLGSIGWNYKSNTLSASYPYNDQSVSYGLKGGGGLLGTYYYNGRALNSALTWETSEQFDIGIDAAFLKDRLNFVFDFYNKRTYNLIQEQSSGWPDIIGVSPMKINCGEVMNRGIELSLGWQDKVGNWSYYVNGNAAYNKNWVSDIGVTTSTGEKGVWTGDGSWRNGEVPYIYQTAEGEALNSFYMVPCLGIFQSDAEAQAYTHNGNKIQPNAQAGDLKFEDVNGDGQINNLDRVYCGNATPDWTYALNAGFTWKNLSFSAMFQGVQGAQAAYMAKYSLLGDHQANFNRSVDILNAWSPTNTSSDIPRLTRYDLNGNFTTPSTWYLEDASYLRLKNVTISYDLTSLVRKCAHFAKEGSSLMVYFSGENLFTITKYSGMDPECGGWDGCKYPVSRVLSFGIKLTY